MVIKRSRFRVLVALVCIVSLSALTLKWLSMKSYMAYKENQRKRFVFLKSNDTINDTSKLQTRTARPKADTTSHKKTKSVNVNSKNASLPKSNDRKIKINQKIKTVKIKRLKSSFTSTFHIVDSVDDRFSIVARSYEHFVLVVPHVLKRKNSKKVISKHNKKAAMIAANILKTLTELDGLACLPKKYKSLLRNASKENFKGLFNRTWCNFKRRDWSIQIRNNGKIKAFQFISPDGSSSYQRTISKIQMCNIVNMPFVIKTEAFIKWEGLEHDFGRLSLLDFFVRTGGKLRIGKSADCFYSDDLFEIDRGNLNGEGDFPEYSNFGGAHDVLRIIMEDRIEWTKCVATDQLCKEEPYSGPPTKLPGIAQPICCSVMLNQILKDSVAVFNKLGIKYRVIFGTLLGGERSGSIIPYTRDIDFTLESKYGKNKESYASLQKYFGNNYFISGHSFIDFPRLIPLMPAHLNITTAPFFKDEYDVEGDSFFSRAINRTVEEFLPFEATVWNMRGYADFYRMSGAHYWNGSSTTVINGVKYDTLRAKGYELEEYYSKDWRIPILTRFDSQSDTGQAKDNF